MHNKLKQVRKLLNLTQPQAAERLGVSLSMYKKYEAPTDEYCLSRAGLAVRQNWERMVRNAGVRAGMDHVTHWMPPRELKESGETK